MKKYKYYYTYLVILTNKESSMFGTVYFGKRKTNNLNDGYIGSGKLLQNYLKKYPFDYYREIIKFYDSEEELNKAEYDLIHPHLGKSYCLNLVEGGTGGVKGFPNDNKNIHSKEANNKISLRLKELWQNPEYRAHMVEKRHQRTKNAKGWKASDETKRLQSERKKENPTKYWLGKSLPDYMKKAISDKQKGRIITQEELDKRSKSMKGKNKGKHKVWDNKELNKYHMEY